MKGDDAAAINKALENVAAASQALGKIIYEQAAREAGAKAAAGGTGPSDSPSDSAGGSSTSGEKKKDEDVIDAEFEVKE
jgi:hypothetical protein